jgi:hypothetical protein
MPMWCSFPLCRSVSLPSLSTVSWRMRLCSPPVVPAGTAFGRAAYAATGVVLVSDRLGVAVCELHNLDLANAEADSLTIQWLGGEHY